MANHKKQPTEAAVCEIRRRTRRKFTAEEREERRPVGSSNPALQPRFVYAIRMNFPHRTAILCSLLLAGSVAYAIEPPLSLELIGDAFGISAGDVKALRKGKRVGGELSLASDNELALSVGLRTTASPADLWTYAVEGRTFEVDPTIVQHGLIGEDAAESLAKLTLPDVEIERLAKAEPGPDINLSTIEIESLQKITASTTEPSERRDSLLNGFRQILQGRVEAYRKGGLEAVVPYDRGKAKGGAPAVELEHALGELRATQKLAPRVYDAIAKYPHSSLEGVKSDFYWIVHAAKEEVLVTLSHRVYAQQDDHIMFIDHRYYVSHTANSMQVVFIAVPAETGSIVIYANRTYTDLVAGFLGKIARGIGRTIMRTEIKGTVDAFQRAAESP
jgi:hypothetical protein